MEEVFISFKPTSENKAGVSPKRILFLNLIASPEGISVLNERFPEVKIITTYVDEGLDPVREHVLPGLAEFGGRYFGTDSAS